MPARAVSLRRPSQVGSVQHGAKPPIQASTLGRADTDPSRFKRSKCRTELQAGGVVENGGKGYRLICRLGSGCFAEVFRAQCSNTKTTVAVKILPEDGETSARFHQKEAQRLLKLKHPNIVAASDTFRFVGQQCIYTCIVMEFCGGGTLMGQIKSREIDFSSDVINRYLYQISNGLDYLHSNGIVHGDLKSDNILLTKRNQPKISDFGHSRRTVPNDPTVPRMQGGDLMFAPPEYNKDANLSTTFDMWSLGCILCEMATTSLIASRSPGVPFANNPPAFNALMQEMGTAHEGTYFPIVRSLFITDPKFRMAAVAVKQKAAEMGGKCVALENVDGLTASASSGGFKWLLHKLTG